MRTDVIASNPYKLWPHEHPGAHPARTDVLDHLVGEGAFFPNVITAAPYTGAAHGSVLTGQFPLHNGLHEFYNGSLGSPSVFTYGRRAGRRTIMKVDFPIILGPELGFTRDVDVYLPEDDAAFIEAVAAAKSTVCLAHFGGVHVPYGFHNLRFGGKDYLAKVAELEDTLPLDGLPFHDRLMESPRSEEDTNLLFRYKRAILYLYAERRYDMLFQLYLDGVEYFVTRRLQPFVERLTEQISATGRRMLLVLFADHGEVFDEYSCGHFNSMAEGVLRVPLVIVGADVEPAIYPQRIRTVDIAPTVLELADISSPAAGVFDGRSLGAVVRGQEPLAGDSPALAEAYTSDLDEFNRFQERQLSGGAPGPLKHFLVGQAAYLDNRKLVRLNKQYADSFNTIVPAGRWWVEAFDDKLRPRLDDGLVATDLVEMLDNYRSAVHRGRDIPVTDEIRNQLRSLGYSV
jgi:choline-sulfatase